ncbi:MFS transporter [Jiangella alkaliphila]|uniref:Drug resistance transporter, EmrB/QacA subfamily n=1 Tax=Jiangella alkaliphila TaxID=419479 RepID=A0A1H2KNL8_9ACTN|nr:MFS transporter [Jiangella alkaliphila]SDU70279.1 drug resistance transporter, EmrB/QacA subfamily [Jiangella alkaliphila]
MDQATIHQRRWSILGVLVVSLLVVVLDNTVLNVALRTIQDDLSATQSELEWAINSYTLVFAGLLFTFGLLGDRFGRRRMLMFGLLLFGIASAVSAYASSPEQLIAARAFMGIGAAAVMPATLAIITQVFEPEERGRAIGIWVASVGISIVLGPVLGGALLERFWWGSVFLINVPVVVIGLALIAWLVPESRNPSPGRLDPGGVLLSIVGLTLLVYGIIEGGERATVTDPLVWGSVAGGLAVLVLFVWYERRSTHPALDIGLFRNPVFSASVTTIGLVFFAMLGTFFFMTFYLQIVRGYSPLEAGLMFLPFAIAQTVFSTLSETMVRRFGIRAVTATGLSLVALSLVAMGFIDETTPLWFLLAAFFIQGAGIANVMPPATTAVMAAVPREKAGVGSAVNNTMRQVGGALGVAVLGAVLSARYRTGVEDAVSVLPEDIRHAAGESIGTTMQAAERAGVVAQVRGPAFDAFIGGVHWVAFLGAAVAALSVVVVAVFLPGRSASRAPSVPAGAPETPEPETART